MGLLALDRSGVNVGKYYSSEIDKNAIAVQRKRFFGRITEIGEVQKCTKRFLGKIAPIHLQIGGSPCSELSRVNPTRKIFAPGSSGRLVVNYVNVMNYLKKKAAQNNHRFNYLFENTAHMYRSTLETLKKKFNLDPQVVDATSFVPKKRKRLFWHNLGQSNIDLSSIQVTPLEEFLDSGRTANLDIVMTVTTNSAKNRKKEKRPVIDFDGEECNFNVNEMEKLFEFVEGFTDTGSLSITTRKKLIVNAWVVPVITYLLNPLQM
ncbi:hypothetical protein FOCC_FOCC009185 [Frankliniella occidentalis]|nr:hypothetical protein FOCC_FOCC009185 [Frankliniella occidentalis]